MDSKVREQVFRAVTAMLIITFLAVFAADSIQKQSRTNREAARMEDTANEDKAHTEEALQSAEKESGLTLTKTVYGDYLLDMDPGKDPEAFLKDMDFFDPEIVTQLDRVEAASGQLTMLAVSVNKDLRISIINGRNEIVSGYPFEIELTDQKRETTIYTDEDKDGTLYLSGMEAGNYDIKLVEYGDYETLASNITASVKDEIEYRVLDDALYLLKDESQIDAREEDTEIKGALADADNTEVLGHFYAENTGFGIDVSKWNEVIDWPKVKEAGVDFAIIRCGYRGSLTGALVEDPFFKRNIEGALASGIKVGVYFFTQATSVTEAMEEASIAVSLVKEYPIAYPVFIDTEGAGQNARAADLDADSRTQICRTFCETVEAAGFNAGIYANKNWLMNCLDADKLQNYYIWLAEYKGEATYDGNYDFWQYTSSGRVDGIEGRVDLNAGYVGF